jgi:class 3 adenylate cyclase
MAETTTSASAATPDRRKLVAIVYADMVGCSGLIGLDDQRTLERLCTLRRTLIDPAIGQHGGRIFRLVANHCSSCLIASMALYVVQSRYSSRCLEYTGRRRL